MFFGHSLGSWDTLVIYNCACGTEGTAASLKIKTSDGLNIECHCVILTKY